MKIKLIMLMFGIILLVSTVSAATWVNDPNNCPTSAQSQTCSGSDVVCGLDGGITYCFDPSSLSAPSSNSTTSSNVDDGSFDGGYLLDCESYDFAAPFCDNSGNFNCDRNSIIYSTEFRQTICLENQFGVTAEGACRSGYYDCYGDTTCESTSSTDCQNSNNNHYTTATCNTDLSGGAAGTCVCDTNKFACDGSIIDTDGCEISAGVTCGSSTGYIIDDQCFSTTAGNCTASSSRVNNRDCDNSDSDNNEITCNSGNGCEITLFSDTNNPFSVYQTCTTFACQSGYLDCSGTGDGTDVNGCEITEGASCGNSTGTYAVNQCQSGSGNCTSAGVQLDCNDDDGDAAELTCNGADGCEITNGSACSVGVLSGNYSGCSGSVGNCVVSKSFFETGTEASYLTSDALLWGAQYGSGALMNFTNANTGESFLVNGSGCIIFPDNTTQCTGTLSTNFSTVAILNATNIFTANQTFSENITVVNTGFFAWLGSITNFITGLFVTDINLNGILSGNGSINISGNIETVGSIKASETYIFSDDSTQAVASTPDGTGWHVTTASFNQVINVTIEEVNPTGLFFKPDGRKMYVVGSATGEVNEYDLSTPWDISTFLHNQVLNVSLEELKPAGLFFKPDGSKMYIAGNNDDDITEYSLSTAWDINTSLFTQNFSVSTQDTTPTDVFFKPDGSVMYVLGNFNDTLFGYDLTTPWDISTAVLSQSFYVGEQSAAPHGIFFKSDGTILYVVDRNSEIIYEYNLYTPWNVSIAILENQINPSSESGDSTDIYIFLKPDGSKLYVLKNSGDKINEYDLGLVIGGNVGIGTTSPNDKLEVYGDLRINTAATDNDEIFFTDNGQIRSLDDSHRILFRRNENLFEIREYGSIIFSSGATSGNETATMYLDSGGNVGIGTTSPTQALDVNGSVNISENLTLGQKIVFALGGFIQNIVSGRVDVSGTLNVTGNTNIEGSLTVTNNIDITNGSLFQPVYGSDDSLVLYMPFSEPDGSLQFDRSPYGNDGTQFGNTECNVTFGKYGSACTFDGENDYVRLASKPPTENGPFTLEAWINADSLAGAHTNHGMGIMASTLGDTIGDWMLSVDNDGAIQFHNWITSGDLPNGRSYTVDGVITEDQWHHVVAVWDGTSNKIFIDGVDQGTLSTTNTASGWTLRNEIGRSFIGSLYSFNGTIDEVKVYTRALASEEVRTHYLRGSGFGASGAIIADKFRVVNTTGTNVFEVNSGGAILNEGVFTGNGSGLINIGADSLSAGSINTTHILDETITDADINDSTNLTLGQKIIFALGGFIQNIVSGRVDINGTLNVTGGLNVSGNVNVEGNLTVGNNIDITNGSLFQPVYPSDDGLVLYIPFSEPNGSTQYDRSPYGNDGTQVGANCNSTNGKYGNGCYFDGVDDYVGPVSGFTNINDTTITAWINPRSVDPTDVSDKAIFHKGVKTGCNPSSEILSIRNSKLKFTTGCGSIVSSNSNLQKDTWQHVAVTINSNGEATLFINGIQESSPTNTRSGQSASTGNELIGAMYISGTITSFFNGTIDEFMVYNRVLAPEEIRTHYLRGSGFGASGAIIADKFRVVNTSGTNVFEVNSGGVTLNEGVFAGNGSGLTDIGADSLSPNSINNTHIVDGTITDVDINNSTNLTLGQKIVFALGGFIQNIVSGRVDINGTLNVSGNVISSDYLVDSRSIVNIETPTPYGIDSTGLVGYWTGNGNTKDYSGYGNDGTLINQVKYSDGVFGKGFEFDGSGDYVDLGEPDSLKLSQFTISTWFFREGTGVVANTGAINAYPLVTKGRGEVDGSNIDMNYFLGVDESGVIVADFESTESSNNNYPILGVIPILNNNWYHAVATYNGSDWALYLNGNLENATSPSVDVRSDSIQDNAIGSALNSVGTPQGYWDGLIDEVMIYSRALSSDEISALYTLGKRFKSSGNDLYYDGNVTIEGDLNVSGNLTLGQKIVFALGGFIQNIVSGRVDVNGSLNVTGGLNVDSGTLFVNETNDRVGIGTTSPTEKFHLANGTFLQTPGDPSIVGGISSSSLDSAFGVYVSGKYAYVASFDNDSLSIIDISDPTSPTIVGGITDSITLDGAHSVYVSGKYAYVSARFAHKFQVLDVSDPTSPIIVGTITDSTNLKGPTGVYVSGKYAYVANIDDNSLRIIDISNPTNPSIVGGVKNNVDLLGATDVYVSGTHAYVASNANDSLRIIDVSDPTNPIIVGGVSSTNLDGATNVHVSGKYAYVASITDNSFRIINISDPTSPSIVGGVKDNVNLAGAIDVYVAGKYAYVVSVFDDSLRIIDISDPTSPSIVGGVKNTVDLDGAIGIYVSGKYAYVTSGNNESLRIIDIGGIDSPAASIGTISTSTLDVLDNAIVGNNLYVQNGLDVGPGGIYSDGPVSFGNDTSIGGDLNVSGDLILGGNLNLTGNTNIDGNLTLGQKIVFALGGFIQNIVSGRVDINGTLNVAGDAIVAGDLNVSGNATIEGNVNVTGDLISQTIYDVSSQGLVLAMNFNNGSVTGNTVIDSSGENNHGTNNGAAHNATGGFDDLRSGVYEFDGTNDYIDLGDSPELRLTQDFTLSAWVYKTGSSAGVSVSGTVIGKEMDSSEGYTLEVLDSDHSSDPRKIRFIAFNASDISLLSTSTVSDNTWTHIAAVYNGTHKIIYINGAIDASEVTTGDLSTGSDTLKIGYSKGNANDDNYFNGLIDEVMIYSRSLSSEEVKRVYLQRNEFHDSYVFQKDVYVDNGGNVGIGTTSPTEKLHLANGTFLQTPGDPSIVGGISSTSLDGAASLYVSGKYAYVVSQANDSLRIIDVSDPTSPVIIGGVSDSANLNGIVDVYVSGKYAYVTANLNDSLRIIDVSDPTSPVIVGGISSTNLDGIRDVYVSGKYAYVANQNDDSLRIIDVSDPTSPVIVGGVKDTANLDAAIDVYVSGKYAYVTAFGNSSLQIIDVSDPTNPSIVGGVSDSTNLGGAIGIYVSGKYAYVTSKTSNSLGIVDISDPTNPVIVGSIIDSTNLEGVRNVYVSGKYAYVASNLNDSLRIIDVSDPTSPVIVGSISDSTNLDGIFDVYVSGKYAYVVSYDNDSLRIIDIGGIDAPAASIGDISASTIEVTDNVDIGNNLYVRNGINVGPGGILSDGPVSIGNDTIIGGDLNVDSGTLFVDSDNNRVGIGTSSPNALFHVDGGAGFAGLIAATSNFTSNGSLTRYTPSNSFAFGLNMDKVTGSTDGTHTADGKFIFNTIGSGWTGGFLSNTSYPRVADRTLEWVVDTSDAGVNTTQDDNMMVGWGNGSLAGTNYQNLPHAIYFDKGSNGIYDLRVYESGTQRAVLATSITWGDVLRVKIVLKTTGADYYYKLNNDNWILGFEGTNSTLTPLYPSIAPFSNRFTLHSMHVYDEERTLAFDNGNVGIGTTSPTQKLDINGSVNIADNLTLGQKIVFALGGFIQNIVSGQIDLNGTLNVTNNLIVDGSIKSSETYEFYDGSTQSLASTPDGNGWHVTTASFNQVLNVSNEDTSPIGFFFKPDGTKMYVLGFSGKEVNEYNLSTPWNVSSAVFNQNFSVTDENIAPTGVFFKPDGSKMYVVGSTADEVNEYVLSVAWDISTASPSKVFIVSEDISPFDVDFKPDGTKMYVVGASDDDINEYNLFTPWDISTAVFNQNFSVASEDTSSLGISFKPDGTKMYITGDIGSSVNEYVLSTPWDINTSSFNQLFNVSSEGASPRDVFFKPDGTKMFVLGVDEDEVNEYDLGSVFLGKVGIGTSSPSHSLTVAGSVNITEALVFSDGSIQTMAATPDGLSWHVSSASFKQDLNVTTQEEEPKGVFFKPDGTRMYVVGADGDDVNEYSLTIAWDVSTASFVRLKSVSAQDTGPQGVFFKPDGSKMYILGNAGNDVNEYDLTTAWDISTASFTQLFSVNSQDAAPQGFFFKPDGTQMYVLGANADRVNEYTLKTAWDISTASFTRFKSVSGQVADPRGIFFKSDGKLMYVIGTNDNINEYSLYTPWDVSTALFTQLFNVVLSDGNSAATVPEGLFFKGDGTKVYVVETNNQNNYGTVVEFNLGLFFEGLVTDDLTVNDLLTVGTSFLQRGGTNNSRYAPTVVGNVALATDTKSIKVVGDYAYVLNDGSSNSLQIIDISDVTAPVIISTHSIGTSPRFLDISGRYVYVVDTGSEDLKIIDVSNPTSPVTVGTLGIGTDPKYVVVSGKYAYVVDANSNDLKIIDISNPTAPFLVSSIGIVIPTSVVVSGGYAYVSSASGPPELSVIDISNPYSPVSVGNFTNSASGSAQHLAVSGKYAYLPDINSGVLRIIDISDPTNPTEVGNVSSGSSPKTAIISGDYFYLTDESIQDLRVFNVASSTNPVQVGNLSFSSAPTDMDLSGKYIYLVRGSSFDIIDISGIEVQSAFIHSLEAGSARVFEDLRVGQRLLVQTSLSVGTDALIGGGLSVNGVDNVAFLAATSNFNSNGLTRYTPSNSFAFRLNMNEVTGSTEGVHTADGKFIFNETTASWTGGFISDTNYTRVADRTLEWVVDTTDAVNATAQPDHMMIGWGNGSLTDDSLNYRNLPYAIYFDKAIDGDYELHVRESGTNKSTLTQITWGDVVRAKIVLKATGADYYYKVNNGNWILWYEGTASTQTPLYPSIAPYSNRFTVHSMHVYDEERTISFDGGKVGIGINNAVALLHLNGSNSDEYIRIDAFNGSQVQLVSRNPGNGNSYVGTINDNGFGIVTNNAFRLTVQNDGDVGIGTTTPDGLLEISAGTSGDAGLFITADTDNSNEADNPFIKFSQDGTAVQTIMGHVNGTNQDPENGVYTGVLQNAFLLGTLDGFGNLQFGTNNNVRMTIETGGDVGIGTNNPTTTLDAIGIYSDTVSGTNRDLFVDSDGTIGYVSSSERYKSNITSLNSSDWIYNLRPVTFKWDSDGTSDIGLIAEEVHEVNPDLVSYDLFEFINSSYVKVDDREKYEDYLELDRNMTSGNTWTVTFGKNISIEHINETTNETYASTGIDTITKEITKLPETVKYSKLIVPMLKAIQELKESFESLIGGNYSVETKAVFDEDSVGSATVIANETSVKVEFKNEYLTIPIVTLTPVGSPSIFYVDNVSNLGFDIVISEIKDKDIMFNWHAFAVEAKAVEQNNLSNVNDSIVEDNETIVEENKTIPDENKSKKNETVIEIPNLNDSLIDLNGTIVPANETANDNNTVVINESEEENNESLSQVNVTAPSAEEEVVVFEEIFTEGNESSNGVESANDGSPLITGASIGVRLEEGTMAKSFKKLIEFVGGLFS